MKKFLTVCPLILVLSSCYPVPEIDGFDLEAWGKAPGCDTLKTRQAKLLISQSEKLLGKGEATVKGLLGKPSEHELYNRNQKFFYYGLTDKNCPAPKRLSVKFDALDRAKEIRIVHWE